MKLFFLLVILTTSFAHANITCRGAAKYALDQANQINSGLSNPVTFKMAMYLLTTEEGRIGDVLLGCGKNDTVGKDEFCSEIAQVLLDREMSILLNVEARQSEIYKVLAKNEEHKERLERICPQI